MNGGITNHRLEQSFYSSTSYTVTTLTGALLFLNEGGQYPINQRNGRYFINTERLTNLSFLSLNVCGLRSKTLFPEFNDKISLYDIVGFQETKTDQLDDINIENFICYYKHRKDISTRRSGGIALAYKVFLKPYITIIETDSKLIIWFKISKQFTKTDDILCGVVYIPPEGSLYSVEDPFYEIENELYTISQGARNLKIRSAQLTRQKRFDCIDDKNYPFTTFLGTSYGQIVVAIFQEQAFCTTTPFCNCLRKSAT